MDHLLETVDSPHDLSSPEAVPSFASVPSSGPSSPESKIPSTPEPTSAEPELSPTPVTSVPESEPETVNPEPSATVVRTPSQRRYPQSSRQAPERYTDLWERRN